VDEDSRSRGSGACRGPPRRAPRSPLTAAITAAKWSEARVFRVNSRPVAADTIVSLQRRTLTNSRTRAIESVGLARKAIDAGSAGLPSCERELTVPASEKPALVISPSARWISIPRGIQGIEKDGTQGRDA